MFASISSSIILSDTWQIQSHHLTGYYAQVFKNLEWVTWRL